MEHETSFLSCRNCAFNGINCKCINHRYVHFFRPWFSCDRFTGHHSICSAFQPNKLSPAITTEWEHFEGFSNWYPVWLKQWHDGKMPKVECLILTKPKKGREFSDDRYYIPYLDFLNCNIMRPDGIHYTDYSHIEQSRKSVTGYAWKHEGPGILRYEDLEKEVNDIC